MCYFYGSISINIIYYRLYKYFVCIILYTRLHKSVINNYIITAVNK